MQGALTVLPQTAGMVQPPEASLHYPAFGQHDKLTYFVALDHFHPRSGQHLYRGCKLFPAVTSVRHELLHRRQTPKVQTHHFYRPVAVGRVRLRYQKPVQKTHRVHHYVPFYPAYLLAGVIALLFRGRRVLHALRVYQTQRRLRFAALTLAKQNCQFFLRHRSKRCFCLSALPTTRHNNTALSLF